LFASAIATASKQDGCAATDNECRMLGQGGANHSNGGRTCQGIRQAEQACIPFSFDAHTGSPHMIWAMLRGFDAR
jgi:hypothetical protein